MNMEGKKAEFHNWGKLPYRDPSDRMVRVGHGFSKMLNAIKTNMSKNSQSKSKPVETKEKPKTKRNQSLEPNIRTDNDLAPVSTNSLLEVTKVNETDIYLTMKPKKIKMSSVQKSASKKESNRKQITVLNKKSEEEGLPKIESSKNL